VAEPEQPDQAMPAYALGAGSLARLEGARRWPQAVTRDWAIGGSTGAGVRVCIVDSGVDGDHELVGGVARSVVVSVVDGEISVEPDTVGDVCGHGTACAGIVRSIAPDCELHSVRVLGEGFQGSGPVLIAGLRWAVEQGYDVINMSLSTTKRQFVPELHELADAAYFHRGLIVASAHNMPVHSYPWRFSAVVSVASHDLDDPTAWYRNPDPPVEFYARGIDVEVAWSGGERLRCSGNSFATPHIAGICALIRANHPDLTPPEMKTVLGLTANNAGLDA